MAVNADDANALSQVGSYPTSGWRSTPRQELQQPQAAYAVLGGQLVPTLAHFPTCPLPTMWSHDKNVGDPDQQVCLFAKRTTDGNIGGRQ